MKYISKIPDGDINAPKNNFIKELFYFLIILILFITIIYYLLGFFVDIIAEKIPPEIETLLGYNYVRIFEGEKISEKEYKIQKLLDELVSHSNLKNRNFKVRILETNEVNALAIPGDNIIIFSGLLKILKTENQLSYVLAHELGHFAHRDHLRGIGRGLILSVISIILFGSNTLPDKTMAHSLTNIQLKYTREQEIKADIFAVDLLNKKYHNVAGIKELLENFGKYEKIPKLLTFFTTHPHYTDRIIKINKYIQDKKYKIMQNKQKKLNL